VGRKISFTIYYMQICIEHPGRKQKKQSDPSTPASKPRRPSAGTPTPCPCCSLSCTLSPAVAAHTPVLVRHRRSRSRRPPALARAGPCSSVLARSRAGPRLPALARTRVRRRGTQSSAPPTASTERAADGLNRAHRRRPQPSAPPPCPAAVLADLPRRGPMQIERE
jgi:hypothetical protein